MPKQIKIMAIAASSVFLLFSSVFCEESITITTYYPSPYGSYNELTTTGSTYLATTSGNVGIGTAEPSTTLHVESSQYPLAKFKRTSGTTEVDIDSVSWQMSMLNFLEGGFQKAAIRYNPAIVNQGGWRGGMQMGTYNLGNYDITVMDDNVGIGTAIPTATLEVNGNIKASGGSNNKATCWKGTQIGYCSSVVAADGSCTCN